MSPAAFYNKISRICD